MGQEFFSVFSDTCETCSYRQSAIEHGFKITDEIAYLMIQKTTKISFTGQYNELDTIDYMMLDTAGRVITGLVVKGYYGLRLFRAKIDLQHTNYKIKKSSDNCNSSDELK